MQDFLSGGKHTVAENHGGVKTPNSLKLYWYREKPYSLTWNQGTLRPMELIEEEGRGHFLHYLFAPSTLLSRF